MLLCPCSFPGWRILEWVAIFFSKNLPNPGIKPVSPALAAGFFTTEPPGKPMLVPYCSGFYSFVVYLSEKAMAPHSSTLAWKIPWVGKPGRLQSSSSSSSSIFEIEKSQASNFVLFLNCFGYPGSLYFHKNVRSSSSISAKML